ncbi:MAG: 16S rRNA (cytosine(1402)-N(4))-methyltransferase [Candidatus Zambryskibacteria bacterium RIFCSPHIGHO2_01_FULL_44_22b]|uniref:Ribosomal RNA small subunit methyltransferase H n=1 Tax=Candidatus Zambryskibacteria bacterium RIFCSPHIGHO2_01_FULL_44_22b TaxID=1802737 RepID=A0A1G2T539_9BACT|nr:MAG: 16S rRNA (cytosine(1402)-N(4))-methyltransferase [Candidatus Zambryskibacteria bacterium RIFCSPHIGHO2_01_FULL_44_22b]
MPRHISVLLHESIENLNLGPGKIFVDATYGGGGHTSEVLRKFPDVKVIAIDQDPEARNKIQETVDKVDLRTGNFRDIDTLVGDIKPDAILLDLGFSSDQLEGGVPGLSFQRDEPLDMRLSRSGPTAADILNSWDEYAIELILRGFGEERASRKIAEEIVKRRKIKPFETTFDLVEGVVAVKPRHFRDKIHPATKTFQALRIAVNSELDALESGLQKGFDILKPSGRFAVISFHSLEDRIVKNFFRESAREGKARLITKKPIIPTDEEVKDNPRSRSAKLRVVEKI